MTALAIVLGAVGFLSFVAAGIITYRSRTRLDPNDPSIINFKTGGEGWTLICTVFGATTGLAGVLIGVFGHS